MQPVERVNGVLAAVFTFQPSSSPVYNDAKTAVLKDSEAKERGKMMDRGQAQGTALVPLSLPVLTVPGSLSIWAWCSGTCSFWSGLGDRSFPNTARARETSSWWHNVGFHSACALQNAVQILWQLEEQQHEPGSGNIPPSWNGCPQKRRKSRVKTSQQSYVDGRQRLCSKMLGIQRVRLWFPGPFLVPWNICSGLANAIQDLQEIFRRT